MSSFEEVQIGDCRLILGDCRDVLPTLPKHDLLLTDPPYGLGDHLHRPGHGKWEKHYKFGAPSWDTETADAAVICSVGLADKSIVWGGQFYVLPPGRCWLTWNKIVRNWSSSEAEHAWTNLDKPNRSFDYSHGQLATEGKHYHPTQKPLPLMLWCLSHAPETRTTIDPFAGSGTTGVACVQLGLKFTGIERERKYFDVACERIDNAYRQAPMIFDAPRKQVQDALI